MTFKNTLLPFITYGSLIHDVIQFHYNFCKLWVFDLAQIYTFTHSNTHSYKLHIDRGTQKPRHVYIFTQSSTVIHRLHNDPHMQKHKCTFTNILSHTHIAKLRLHNDTLMQISTWAHWHIHTYTNTLACTCSHTNILLSSLQSQEFAARCFSVSFPNSAKMSAIWNILWLICLMMPQHKQLHLFLYHCGSYGNRMMPCCKMTFTDCKHPAYSKTEFKGHCTQQRQIAC